MGHICYFEPPLLETFLLPVGSGLDSIQILGFFFSPFYFLLLIKGAVFVLRSYFPFLSGISYVVVSAADILLLFPFPLSRLAYGVLYFFSLLSPLATPYPPTFTMLFLTVGV